MMFQKIHLTIIITIVFMVLAMACATVVNPTGGLVDRAAPKKIACFPSDSTVNFSGRRIVIEFDEFIKTNNPSSQIVMNPFAGELPQLEVQGKKLIIKIPDSLKINTTYTISFGGAISDITEGNKALNLKYVFSTGNRLDSFSVTGIITDAYTREVVSDAWIFLHRKENGILESKPDYLVRADESGHYKFSCIAEGEYYVYALKDANSDYVFNLPNEKVAFQSESIQLNANHPSIDSVQLFLFQELDTVQKAVKTLLYRNMVLKICFKIPLQNPTISVSEKTPNFISTLNLSRDTLTMWFQNSAEDTAEIYIRDNEFNDTIVSGLILGQKGRNNESAPIKMTIGTNLISGSLNHFEPLQLTFGDPITKINSEKIIVCQDQDTLLSQLLRADSIGLKWTISAKYKPNKQYKILVLPNCFEDLYGKANDSLRYVFTTTDTRDFGEIEINLQGEFGAPMILEMTNSSNVLILKQYLTAKNQIVNIPLVRPGEYSIRIIFDSNSNGQWDTGNFRMKIQPERIIVLPSKIIVKTNWTSQINWNIR